MRKLLAALAVVACGTAAVAQGLEVHLTRSEPGGPLRAGALYVATPIGEWLYIDMALDPSANGDLRADRDIYLVGPDGTRISQPDLRTVRANRDEILGMFAAIATSDAAAVFPIGRQFKIHCPGMLADNSPSCPRYAFWRLDAGPVDRVINLRPDQVALTQLLFQTPGGRWAAGDYVLTIEGPGDSVTQLPVRIG